MTRTTSKCSYALSRHSPSLDLASSSFSNGGSIFRVKDCSSWDGGGWTSTVTVSRVIPVM